MKYLIILISVFFLSCSQAPVKQEPVDSVEVGPITETPETPAAKVYKSPWDAKHPEYTGIFVNALNQYAPDLMKEIIPGACGDRVQYLLDLFTGIAFYESGYSASDQMTEAFKDNSGDPQVSAGVFQLSLDDKTKGSACNQFVRFSDVLDAKKNIECGVVTMNKLFKQDKVVTGEHSCTNSKGNRVTCYEGGARYWSVLREPELNKPHHKADILKKAKVNCK